MASIVAIQHIKDKQRLRQAVHEAVSNAMSAAAWKDHIPAGACIALKPNLCIDILFPGFTTSPWVLEGVIRTVRQRASKILIIESDTWTTNAEKAARVNRIPELCRHYDVTWVNMSQPPFNVHHCPDNLGLDKEVIFHEILQDSHLITVPVMKAHGNSVISGAVKNQWGCLTKARLSYHAVLDDALVDLNRLIKPHFCVMDATIASEGKGPKEGTPRVCDMVLAAADNVAMDRVACDLMGIDIRKVTHLIKCANDGTGTIDLDTIDILGDIPEPGTIRPFDHGRSLITTIDLFCQNRPALKRLMYETPVFHLLVLAARLNYPIWLMRTGNALRKDMLATPYGRQWQPQQEGQV